MTTVCRNRVRTRLSVSIWSTPSNVSAPMGGKDRSVRTTTNVSPLLVKMVVCVLTTSMTPLLRQKLLPCCTQATTATALFHSPARIANFSVSLVTRVIPAISKLMSARLFLASTVPLVLIKLGNICASVFQVSRVFSAKLTSITVLVTHAKMAGTVQKRSCQCHLTSARVCLVTTASRVKTTLMNASQIPA